MASHSLVAIPELKADAWPPGAKIDPSSSSEAAPSELRPPSEAAEARSPDAYMYREGHTIVLRSQSLSCGSRGGLL